MSDFEIMHPDDRGVVVPGKDCDARIYAMTGLAWGDFSTDLTTAWRVVKWVYDTRGFGGRRRFWGLVQSLASETQKEDIGMQYVIAYPDVLHLAGDHLPYYICKAALTLFEFEANNGDPG